MDDFPTCQVCQQHFKLKGPSPYLLPCLHAVCGTCVTSTAGGVISCSTCQREVNLTETHLQKDVVRQREIFHLTVQHRPSELLCTHEDDGNQAVCWCQECEEFLCEHCQTLHEGFKATRRHAVQEIADIQPGSLDHDEYCCTHTNCPLDYLDLQCNILICGRCRRGDHADHEVMDINIATGGAKAEFVAREQEVRQVGVHHNSLLDTTREQLKSSSETSNTLSDKISHTFHSMKALLDQREKELLIALQRHTDATKSHFESKTNNSQFSQSRCKMTSEYIQKALLYSSKYDLLKIKKTIGETTQSCIDSAPPKEEEGLPLPVFNTEGLDRLKASLSSFGEIKTVKDVSSQKQMFQDKATQAGAEYFAKLEEMENRHKMHLKQFEDDFKSKMEELQTEVKDVTRQKKKAERDAKDANEASKKLIDEIKTYEEKVFTYKQKIQSLESSVEDNKLTVTRLRRTLEELGLMPDSTYHLLKKGVLDKSFVLQCLQLKFDRDRVNINMVHINTEGELVNKPDTRPRDHSKDRLVKYWGTTSTVPLPLCGSPQYWEMRARVGIDKTLTKTNLLLEIGLSVEEERDQYYCIYARPHSYSLNVSHCTTHSSICRKIWKHGEYVLCLPDTLPNIPGQSTALHYGVVFDNMRYKAVFMDITNNKVMSVIDGVDCSRPLWPMFGVYNPQLASVSMSLVVGNDIDMSEGKKAMILTSLS